MNYIAADPSKYMNEFGFIFESTDSGWFFRSLGVGFPSGGAFSIGLKPGSTIVTISHVDGSAGVQYLKVSWETFFKENGIEFEVEDR